MFLDRDNVLGLKSYLLLIGAIQYNFLQWQECSMPGAVVNSIQGGDGYFRGNDISCK